LNRPEEVEQYFPVYGFSTSTEQEIQYQDHKQDEKKKNKDILYSGSKKKKQHTYRVKNLHSKNELGLL
jgi:hypothetical protein